MSTWREALRDSLANIDDFAAHCKQLGGSGHGWVHADSPELVGLEHWGTELAKKHHEAGVGALVTAARAGFGDVAAAGGAMLADMGMTGQEGDPNIDGMSCQVQIGRAARWLDDPNELAKVQEALDPSRQLYVWDDDLRPDDASSFFWYLDVGQLCSSAILNVKKDKRDPHGGGYYEWPSESCVGRGLVAVARAQRGHGVKVADVLAKIHKALADEASKP